jgi:N-acetylmuramoyl-L-alanine amidase
MRFSHFLSFFGLVALIAALVFGGSVAPAAAATCAESHYVQHGDTLFRIARRYGTTVAEIQRLNGLGTSNTIYAGTYLCVREAATGSSYVVQYGDTLGRIARRYGISWRVLAQVNGISNPNLIYAGQVLTIPDVTIQ